MKINDIFFINQGHQITDEEIYRNIGKIPILTGDNEIKGYWNNAIVDSNDLPCLTYPTKGNSGVCFVQNSVFDANNTAILIPKPEWKSKIILEWFAFKLSKLFPNISTSKKGVSYLNKEIVENIEIIVPLKDQQQQEIKSISKLREFSSKIVLMLSQIQKIKSSSLNIVYEGYQAKNLPINSILECMSGNSGLTEEFLYSQIQNSVKRNYLLLTGSIDYTTKKFIHRCTDPTNSDRLIEILENKAIIHVIRKGIFAGNVSYFDKGNYTINDDAYLLYLKNDVEYKVNLQWLMYELKNTFFDYVSSSDNKTWNMTGFFDNVLIDIPSIKEQERVVQEFIKLISLENSLDKINQEIYNLLDKEIIS